MIKSKKLSSLVAASLILAGGSFLGVQTVSADDATRLAAVEALASQNHSSISELTEKVNKISTTPEQLQQIDTNKDNITKNQTAIQTNADAIKKNSEDIATNKADIATNKADIATNKSDIATNKADIATNKADIATNKSDIATNKADIATNKADIATNKADIATNKADIATNKADIATNKADIATNKSDIATNKADIATNKADIATNKADIASNKSDIATNKADIATNKSDIATNKADIATNKADIAQEVKNRTKAVADEAAARESGDNALQSQIKKESAARQADISRLDNKIHDVSKEVDTVGALSMAMSGLHPLSYDEGDARFQLSAAVGTYDGTEALALGGFYHFNRDSMLSVGVATDLGADEHRMGANVGYTRRIGQGGHVSRPSEGTVSDIMKDIKNLEQKQAKLEQENEQLKQQLAALKK
ncbi:YadA-like family protein [Dialister succinatiphilus]|uniref:YadA-like family protein n=1 Tax=Dialister succinatiphilus TaxID=487173 RepID=UPI003AB4FE45